MTYQGSYLWRLRQLLGHDLVLMPGAVVALQRKDRRVLLTKRTDDETWCLPAGAAEPGGSFARTAVDELAEETGIRVAESDLIPFGSLSEAEAHTIHYPNGDITHCFALLSGEGPAGNPRPDQAETTETKFIDWVRPPGHSTPRPHTRSSCWRPISDRARSRCADQLDNTF